MTLQQLKDERVEQAKSKIYSELMLIIFYIVVASFCVKALYFHMDLKQCATEYIILILTLAVSLKATITSLGASIYVHDLMEGAAATLYSMLPAVIFVVACILAFASGTSWGTFGILIPIVTAIFPASSELLIIGISACCAGAVMGDHCSPISDTSIMASAGAQCDHLEHVATQIPYVLTVAGVCVVGFIVAGFVQNVYITWAVSFALMLCVLFVIRSMERKAA